MGRCVFTCCTLAWISLFHLAHAQNRNALDSLKNVLLSHPSDTLYVLAAADLCYEYRFINQDSALIFGKLGIERGKKLGSKRGLAQVQSDAAFIYFDRGDFNEAISLWSDALALRLELKDRPRVASLQMKLGGAYFRMGDYGQSLKYQLDALRTYEELNIPQGIGQALNNVAAVYEQDRNLDKALEYYRKAFDIHQKSDNRQEMATTTINIGNIYFRENDFKLAKTFYQDALAYFPGESQTTSYAICLNNLSEIYIVQQKYDSARVYSMKALDLRTRLGDVQGMISSMNMLGRVHVKLGQFVKGEKYLTAALDSVRGRRLLPEEGKILLNLHELYKMTGDLGKSLYSYISYTVVKDSLLNESGRKNVAELQVRYETEKKEQQIALHEATIAEKQARIQRDYLVIAALVITLVLGGLVFLLLRNRQRKKLEMDRKEKEISVREAYIRASVESQEAERKRFARDLHDGIGQWISALRLTLSDIHSASSDQEKLLVLERSDRILHEINHEFRSIAFNLMPYTLIQYGLKPALDEMVSRLNSSGKTQFSVSAFDFPERMTELEEISLYRVIQEWTNNIIKYAGATTVSIQLTGHDSETIVMIEDNGRGFDPEDLERSSGNGWKNIRSRMNLVKGLIDIDTSPQRTGTTLTLTLLNTRPAQASVAATTAESDL